jgi:uncharacterized DUF497 family protein
MRDLFEWDPEKAASNLKKHDVSFEEAASVFGDELSLTISDPLHSHDEERFIILGSSVKGRYLVVVHTDRNDKIRIISARQANAGEIKRYERQSK